MTGAEDHIEPSDSRCPVCGWTQTEIVNAYIKGYDSSRNIAIKACNNCETLWGEPKEFYGIVEGDSE